MDSKPTDTDWITRQEAARLLNKSSRTLLRWDKKPSFPAPYRPGTRCVLFSRQEIEAYAARLPKRKSR